MSKKTEKEYNPYLTDNLAKIPAWVKISFLKFWAAGVTCYLVFIGLNTAFADLLDRAFVFCFVLGLINEWIVNNIIRMMDIPQSGTEKYTYVSGSSVASLFLNIIYAIIVYIVLFTICGALSFAMNWEIYFEEPFFFASIYVLGDAVFLVCKNYLLKAYRHMASKRKLKEI